MSVYVNRVYECVFLTESKNVCNKCLKWQIIWMSWEQDSACNWPCYFLANQGHSRKFLWCWVLTVINIMGDSRKYPYPTVGGMNPPPPFAFGNSKMLYPQALWIFFFSDPLEFLFDCIKLLTNVKLVFPLLPSPPVQFSPLRSYTGLSTFIKGLSF